MSTKATTLIAALLSASCLSPAFAASSTIAGPIGGGGGGSTTIVSGTTPITGGADKQLCFNDGGVISCGNAGLTFSKATGLLTASGFISVASAGTAAAPSLSVGNATTGLYSVSTTGFGISVNGVNKADYGVSNNNTWTFTSNIISGAGFTSPSGGFFQFLSRSVIYSPADSNILIQNQAGTSFNLLQFGGTTSSFPALKRSTTSLIVRLADDSADTGLEAASYNVGGTAGASCTLTIVSHLTVVNGIVTVCN